MPTILTLNVPIESGDPLESTSCNYTTITDRCFDAKTSRPRLSVVGRGDMTSRSGEKIEVSLNFHVQESVEISVSRLVEAINEHSFPKDSTIIKMSKSPDEGFQSETVYRHQ